MDNSPPINASSASSQDQHLRHCQGLCSCFLKPINFDLIGLGGREIGKGHGDEGLASEFKIITKPSMALNPEGATKAGIISTGKLAARHWRQITYLPPPLTNILLTPQVEYYILHNPVHETPISETMERIQELYLAGNFTHFGLSNFSVRRSRRMPHLHKIQRICPPNRLPRNLQSCTAQGRD